jgi:hypothetical protein
MSLNQRIPRNLEDPARILGLSPVELAACALSYSFVSPLLRGVPFAALLSLTISLAVGLTMLVLNRTYPPNHGILKLLQIFRPRVTLITPFGLEEKHERNRQKTR